MGELDKIVKCRKIKFTLFWKPSLWNSDLTAKNMSKSTTVGFRMTKNC